MIYVYAVIEGKISLMLWGLCMLLYFLSVFRMPHLYSRWWQLKEQSSIGKVLLECTLLYHMHLHRWYIVEIFSNICVLNSSEPSGIWQYTFSTWSTILPLCTVFSGCYWGSIHFASDNSIWRHCLCNDWFWMDSSQVFLVPFLHVLHTVILHILWHDGSWIDTKSWNCCHCILCFLWNVEHLLRLSNPTTCKF